MAKAARKLSNVKYAVLLSFRLEINTCLYEEKIEFRNDCSADHAFCFL